MGDFFVGEALWESFYVGGSFASPHTPQQERA